LKELCQNFDYPKEILDFDYEKHLSACINGTVFDMEHGLMLKIGEENTVVKALYGFESLSQEEI
jgi:hypothetical protein